MSCPYEQGLILAREKARRAIGICEPAVGTIHLLPPKQRPPVWGMLEYYRQLAEGRSRENVQPVKLKAPQGITHVITLTGQTVAVNLDRTIELTEKEAGPLRAAGFADV